VHSTDGSVVSKSSYDTTQKVRIRLKAFDYQLIDQSAMEIVNAAKRSGAIVQGPTPLATRMKRFDILRSPQVLKKSLDPFEIGTHQRIMNIVDSNENTVKALQKLVLPQGVDMEIKSR
jgi:small subunit ribosomal protein S10